MDRETDDLLVLLKKFIINIDSYETHDIIYIRNMLQNGIIDSFREGKVTREVMERYLFTLEAPEDMRDAG